MTTAALYLRSSKDAHDLSIDAQRRKLHEFAQTNDLTVGAEFADAVESGKDEDRPGFQSLLAALRSPDRTWSVVLALDTSRIARRRHLALIFEHEAEKSNVTIRYANVPDTDEITAMLLRSILQAMDEWHSLTSKAKGLAGMAESVRQGWRAGGRAPRGYQLEHTPTGTMRDGKPVMRSKLVPADDLEQYGIYLRARASGKPRGIATSLSGIKSSLNDLEWQALTYAGHTVWNMQAERGSGSKRRPREEWQITKNTHPAIITDQDAENILHQLESRQGRRNRSSDRVYLLSGLLVNPDGKAFSGETTRGQSFYRLGKGKRISAAKVDAAVLDQVFSDLSTPAAIQQVAARMRHAVGATGKPRNIAGMETKVKTLTGKIDTLVGLLADGGPQVTAYQRVIGEMETERQHLLTELEDAKQEEQTAKLTALWTPDDVRRLLGGLLQDLKSNLDEGMVAPARTALAGFIDHIELDPGTGEATIHYRLSTGVKLASPRGHTVAPVRWSARMVVG